MRTILLSLICILGLGLQLAWAQGSTTASMNGEVTDENGGPIPGASVQVVHEPTGTEYINATNGTGFFRIANMRVGGPYTLTVSFVGYDNLVQEGIYLDLGQTFNTDVVLSESTTQLQDVVISAGGLIDGNRTGAETNIGREQIMNLPTVNRNLNDFTRLTPQANITNGGISIAGVNNRFNTIYIDGAVNNDVFGLANSGTNGGQAGISPISLDALEQIQVVVAPYDVTLGGFAGGGINAVTRSGKNFFEGSAYYYFRNENLAGKTPGDIPDDQRTRLAPFSVNTYGFRLGGPIVKDKLFFFTNVELLREEEPFPFIPQEYEGSATAADINQLVNYLGNEYGYNPGGYLNNIQTRNSDKVIAKLDWNINRNHKLSARHSYVFGNTDRINRPTSRDIFFFNTGNAFPTTTNSTAIELKSNFGNSYSNNLILGYTRVRDDRELLGDPFPKIEIRDNPAVIHVGSDNFSYSNVVFQDVFTLTNNFNWYKGRHTFTLGTHNEFFQIENLFTVFSTPRYFYDSLEAFTSGAPGFALFGHEQLAPGQSEIRLGDDASNLGPTFNALQMAFYVQDEIQFNSDFKLTVGLRADIPVFLEDPPLNNTQFNEVTVDLIEDAGYDLQGARASQTPATQVLWSPRLGFNWDVTGTKSTQLRGGLGIFTSRVPWVWPGGMFIRNGLNSSFVGTFGPFYATPDEWRDNLANRDAGPSGDVDLFVEDFKYPQVFRTNIAVDQALPWGLLASAEFMYTKTLNNISVQNVNLEPSFSGRLEGTPDDRQIFTGNLIDDTYSFISLVDNTNEGYTWNATVQLQKPATNGFGGSIAYSFTRAESLLDGRGFINATNWRQAYSLTGRNNAMVGRSVFDVGSRVTGSLSYRKEYAGFMATTVSLFYNGQSGEPFSYVYRGGDALLNEDDQEFERALIYIPDGPEDIILGQREVVDFERDQNGAFVLDDDGEQVPIFGGVAFDEAEEQAMYSQLNAYIEGDDYLSERRGQYAEQNRSRVPFSSVFDLKLLQDFYITSANGRRHTLQLSLDIFNVSNLINRNWGRRYFMGSGDNRYVFELLQFEGFEYQDGAFTNRPVYSFTDPGDPWDVNQSPTIEGSRWAAQFGVRYTF
ncbi:TonB-dependent receptor [Tunicatimonas pelagia]|uniref:TonB-dependent receptor n=1 Tax=Tunicatimonas pelagia TaxID=931531 RepID=UPI0026650807|nr:TonB-dependent receptor [Tunicatimonas pelagia]WKN46234.1 TonB-dependent receptor [Tunicatimonas pelagia]